MDNSEKSVEEQVNNLSLHLLQDAAKQSDYNSVVSIGSLIVAAARAAGWSNLPLGTALNLFGTHYQNALATRVSDGVEPAILAGNMAGLTGKPS